MTVAAVSLKYKYAVSAFAVVLLVTAALTGMLAWQHDVGESQLGSVVEGSMRDRIAVELRARAASMAAHAADAVAPAIRANDPGAIARRLQPFVDDSTVASLSVTAPDGTSLYEWHRAS